jgi:DeoR family fructose operon transcriptional repressor
MSNKNAKNEQGANEMSISKRQNEILDIIKERVYVSVNELASLSFTSTSSIRRDLTELQNLGLVKRSYGGVSMAELTDRVAGFYSRALQNVKEKRIIAEKASSLLRDGQSILLDSSTTASFLIPTFTRKSRFRPAFQSAFRSAARVKPLPMRR